MGKLEELIKEKGKELPIGQPYLVKATKYKAGLMIIDVEDLHGIVDEAQKEFPNPESCFMMHTAKIDWTLYGKKVLEWFYKYFGEVEPFVFIKGDKNK